MDSITVMLGFTSDAQMTSDAITAGTLPILIIGGLPDFAPTRNRNISDAMSGYARSMGWDVVDTIRHRARGVSKGGSMQRSAIDLTGVVDYARMKTSGTSDLVDVDTLLRLARSAGRGDAEQVNAELVDIATEYLKGKASAEGGPVAYHETALETNEALAAYNDVPVGGLATDAAAIGGQTAAAGGSAADTRPEPSRSNGGGGLFGFLGDNPAWDNVRVWSSLRQSDMTFDMGGTAYNGDSLTLTLGIEKPVDDNKIIGLASSLFKGEMDMNTSALDLQGQNDLEQWVLMPYAAMATDYGRIWGVFGLGGGTLDYKESHRDAYAANESSDVLMGMAAIGVERDMGRMGAMEVLARIEGMSTRVNARAGDNNLYSDQNVTVQGARGEFEFAWPIVSDSGGSYRPYLTAGYRWDGGGGVNGRAFEFGVGLDINTGHLSFASSLRAQSLGDDGDYDRDSQSFELTYDRGGDGRGLSLNMKNTRGSVASQDYFAQDMSWAQSASSGRSSDDDRARTDFKAGYGIAVKGLLTGRGLLANSGEGVLKPFVKTNLDGSAASEWSMGLTLKSGFGNIDLMHTVDNAPQTRDQHETLLKFTFDF